ncbi:MAG: hypothetical protein AB2558_11865 [Candidatus Thiodiazotropha sp.]
MFDYFYRERIPDPEQLSKSGNWDLFISSYNSSERVKALFEKVNAKRKVWIIAPEYNYDESEYPDNGEVFSSDKKEESGLINELIEYLNVDLRTASICVDITGFMRPHLLFLVRLFYFKSVTKFDVFYSEPSQYKKKDETTFSDGPVVEVRPIGGYEGTHVDNSQNDLLIIGVGYDHELVKQVVEYKDYAHIASLWGFPSLRADMYQENILRASRAGDAVFFGDWHHNMHFAKANDPFSTAQALRNIVEVHDRNEKITNLYLSPLSTKVQVLGFSLHYIYDLIDKEASLVFPFCDSYARETSTGISSIWRYTIELPEN